MEDAAVVEALAAAARRQDPYLTNILASEAENRMVRARAVINAVDQGILAVDTAGQVTFANRGALALLGYGRGDLDRVTVERLAAGASPFLDRLAAACGGGLMSGVDFVRADGSTFPVDCRATRLTRDGVELGFVVAFSDATPVRARERDERRWTSLYRSLLDSFGELGFGVVVGDGERIVHANQVVEASLGYSLEELRAMPSAAALVDPALLPELQSKVAGSETRAGLSIPFDTVVLAKDGMRSAVTFRLRNVDVDGATFFVAIIEPRHIEAQT